MAGLMDGVRNSIKTNVTDIINHANNVVLTDIYKLNEELYDGYQWIAALDSTTCLACAELDNQIRDRIEDFPTEPPLHHNCRCIIVPVLKGMRDDPSQTKFNYEDWFNEQDEATKIDILGPSRYKEYLNGKKVTSFVKDGRVMSLRELAIDRITRRKLFAEIYTQSEKGAEQYSKTSGEIFNYDLSPNDDKKDREIFSNTMKDMGVYADFDESKKETIDYIPNMFDNIKNDFPRINEALKTIGYSDYLPDNKGAYFNPKSLEVVYNKNIFLSEKNIEEYLKKYPGYFASTDKRSIINHELGHAIEKLLIQLSSNENVVKDEIITLLKNEGYRTMDDIRKNISVYAADETFHDTIAEAVSDCLSEKEPRKISIMIYNKLISIYRRFA